MNDNCPHALPRIHSATGVSERHRVVRQVHQSFYVGPPHGGVSLRCGRGTGPYGLTSHRKVRKLVTPWPAHKYLVQAIRNRDAPSYIENKRRRDFPAVGAIFVPAFNALVQAMMEKGHFNTTGH